MILPTILYTLKGKLLLGLATISAALLAAGEANSNQTLIVIAGINLFGTFILGIATIVGARISANNAKHLAPLAELPARVEKLAEGIDGVAHELKEATKEGNLAKVDAANAKGQLEGREAEIAKQGAAALAKQDGAPAEVIQVNPPENPANVKVAP